MIFILLPMAIGIFILREPIIRLAFERGEFTAFDTEQAAYALGIMAVGIVAYGLTTILSRALFADKDGKTPAIITIVAIGANAAIALIFTNTLGIGGPALAATISLNIAGFGMYAVVAKKYRIFCLSSLKNFGKMVVAAFAMLSAIYFIIPNLDGIHDIFTVGFITILGILIYAALSLFLKIDEAQAAKTMILSRIRRSADE